MTSTLFFKAWFVGCMLVYMLAIRTPHLQSNRTKTITEKRGNRLHSTMMWMHTIGWQLLPAVYIFTRALSFADYRLPPWMGWLGVAMVGGALALNWRAHVEMGSHWTPTLELEREQSLITSGVFRYIRHPIYASFWLWNAGQALLLQNWIAGLAGLLLFAPLYAYRMRHEERMMLEQFGEEYATYMRRTGRIVPLLGRR